MLRKYFINKLGHSQKENIRWRSHEVSRIEAFSDAVFAFAVSLLVISLEVPKSSKELIEMMEGFFPFIFSFAAIFWVWRTQYKFFRRYGMHDNLTIGLNGVLLFVVLFFVYPLKFLFSSMIMPDRYVMSTDDFATMTIIL